MVEKSTIRALKKGDPTAWEELIAQYGDRLFRSARMLGADEHTAEDMVQETYVHFAASLGRYRRKCALYSWLHGILYNRCRAHFRKQQRCIVTDTPPEQATDTPLPETGLVNSEDSDTLRQGLKIRHDFREILVLFYFEDMPVAEIAQLTKVPQGTVKSRLFKARKALHQHLQESAIHKDPLS